MAACVLVGLALAHYVLGFEHLRAVTVSFLTLAFGKVWFVFNLRNPGTRLFDNDIVRNPYILGSILLCAGLLAASVYLPGLSTVLKTRDPGITGWVLLIAMSLVPFILGQGLRMFQTARINQKKHSFQGIES